MNSFDEHRRAKGLQAATNALMDPHDRAMKELIDRLLVLGTVPALAREVGEEAAAKALHELTESAPPELQGAWTLVLAWGRVQKSYEVAAELGDSKEMRASGLALAKLSMDLH